MEHGQSSVATRPRLRWPRVLLPAALLFAAVPSESSGEAPEAGPRAPNLVLITVEGVRADRLGCAGSPGAQTRALDRMAAGGVRFAACDAASPSSRPSHATILTGLFPPGHGVRDDDDVLGPDVPTVAARLAAAGYATAAVVGSSALRRSSGLLRGFAVVDDAVPAGDAWPLAPTVRPAVEVAKRAVAALDTLKEPHFLWVHFADLAAPRDGGGPSSADYDAGLAATDAAVGRVLRAVGRDAYVIVVGSQGEMLGEHGEQGHGLLPLRGARRVPLLLAGPDLPAKTVERCLVRTADVAPTLLVLAGAPTLDSADGASLLPLPSRFGRCGRLSFCEAFSPYSAYGWFPVQMVGDFRWTFVQGPQRGALYDARSDPLERHDLAAEEPVEVGRWFGRLSTAMSGAAVTPLPSQLPDPRREVAVHATVEQALRLARGGGCEQALIMLEKLIGDTSTNAPALLVAGSCELRMGRPESALPLLSRAAELRPDDAAAVAAEGTCLDRLGRTGEAEGALRKALALDPADGGSAARLAALFRGRGETDAALVVLDEAEDAGALEAALFVERGRVQAARGDLGAALVDFLEAASRDSGDPLALEQAARVAVALARFDEAAGLYERLLAVAPERGEVWQALGTIYLERLQRRPAALRCFRQALRYATDEAQRRGLATLVEQLSR